MRWALVVLLDIGRTVGLALACSGAAIAYERTSRGGSLMALCGSALVLVAIATELRLAARAKARQADGAPLDDARPLHGKAAVVSRRGPARVPPAERAGVWRRRTSGRAQTVAGAWRQRRHPGWHATEPSSIERLAEPDLRRGARVTLRPQLGHTWRGSARRRRG